MTADDHVAMSWRIVAVATATVVLTYGSVLVFIAFDSHSHSNSDTLRPFIITVAPVWIVLIAASVVLLHAPRRPDPGRPDQSPVGRRAPRGPDHA